MITVQNLTRTYGDFTAVDKVSFTVEQGEIVGLLGHNGAGKTTIMKMLTGFLEQSSGNISIDGLHPETAPMAVRKKIGYLPENCPVYPEMSVMDYLDYAGSLHGLQESDRMQRLREVILRTSLTDKALQPISTLSRGYRQRVGVAQAILHRPKILILDEPTNGLDPTQILEMRELILELARNSTVIISTHILQEVQAICNRVMIIRNGRKALDTTLKDLQAEQRLRVRTNTDKNTLATLLKPVEAIVQISCQRHENNCENFDLVLAPEADRQETAARVASIIQQAGLPLYELSRQQRSLETIFGEISALKEEQIS